LEAWSARDGWPAIRHAAQQFCQENRLRMLFIMTTGHNDKKQFVRSLVVFQLVASSSAASAAAETAANSEVFKSVTAYLEKSAELKLNRVEEKSLPAPTSPPTAAAAKQSDATAAIAGPRYAIYQQLNVAASRKQVPWV